MYWSTFDADERKRLRFQLTCTWTRSKKVNETESLQVRIEEKHRAGHWLSCPFHAKSTSDTRVDILISQPKRYHKWIFFDQNYGAFVKLSTSIHCLACSLTKVHFVHFYWKLCIIYIVTVCALKISAWFRLPLLKSFLFPELVDTKTQIKHLLISHYNTING